ncbi:MAG: glycine zipper family protein [Pyrinomonadaceae bacterium]|nr:glycine zipper family protein [Pyrinomonadaceae bacterium]
MKFNKSFLIYALSFSLFSVSFLSFTTQAIYAQDSRIALQRGYRTGYSDGYLSGYRDAIDNAAKSYDRHSEYTKADRAFSKDYGSVEDYRDGYQQGFEGGYDTGFEKRSFDATLPGGLAKRGIVASKTVVGETTTTKTTVEEKSPTETVVQTVVTSKVEEIVPTVTTRVSENTTNNTENQTPIVSTTSETTEQAPVIANKTANYNSSVSGEIPILIPTDTELIVELLDDIDTERSKEGDRFKARIISPSEINGAIIEGRISKIQKPGRIKRRAEMLLSFDRVVLTEQRWSNFNAILTEVLPIKGDNVKRVDIEGTVEGKSSVRGDIVKISAATGTGLVVGALAGGPVGAAVGTGVGAAFGVGAVVVERGKHIRLNKDQQLRIKSAYETQIR